MLQVTLPTNFKVAKFDNDMYTGILRQLEKDIDAVRFDAPEGKIELPVKLRVHDSIFVPLAKWSMLLAGNYRCITKDGMRTAQEAVHSNIEESRSVYNFVFDLCVKLGASPSDLVPFEKYAAAAQSLTRPASAARALAKRRAQHRTRRQAGAADRKAEGHEQPGRSTGLSRWSTRGSRPIAKRPQRPRGRDGAPRQGVENCLGGAAKRPDAPVCGLDL